MIWTNAERAGLLPWIFSDADPRDPIAQANDRYAHGGGWKEDWSRKAVDCGDFQFEKLNDLGQSILTYESDDMRSEGYPKEEYHEVCRGIMRDWNIILFEGEWVALVQDGVEGFRLARMD